MAFEIGNFYEHTGGERMAIIGELSTTMYGNCLVAESSKSADLRPVGHDEDAAQNWKQISKGKWLSSFEGESGRPIKFPEAVIWLNNVQPQTGLVYSSEMAEEVIKKMKEEGIKVYGYFGLPVMNEGEEFTLDLEHISHEASNFRVEGDLLMVDIQIMDTPQGRALWEFMQENEVLFHCAHQAQITEPFMGISQVASMQFLAIHAVSQADTEASESQPQDQEQQDVDSPT